MNGPNEDQRSAAARAFAEGGPVGALMSGVDWAAGPLGPPGKWPQRLVETVRIMLSAEQPMALFWGPEFVLLYNEGYAAVIGSKHPRGVGARARDIFPEAWDDTTGQLFRRLVAQRRALLTNDWEFRLERYGFLEQAYFDTSFQPVLMDDGTVGGVLCIVTETTDRVLGERRLRLLTEIGSRTAGLPTPQDVARAVAEVLAAHAEDVPFGCVYLASEQGELRLAGTAGSPGVAPEIVRPDSYGDQVAGHLARVLRKGVPVELPAAGFSEEASGEQRVLALPLPCAGRPAGVLVAGVNPHLPASGAYRDFFDVLVSGIAAALSAALAQEEQRRRAEELDRAKTAFFSNVSHEFRTPLTLFLGPVQEALAEEDRPERRARLELAERNALRLLKLVNALLDVTDSVDLVLTDATMPGLDGFGLVKALRADHRTAGLPVIMLTAQAGEEAAVQGLRAGADNYLAKPFSARQLRARVHANLELTRMRERVLEESRQHLGMLASLTEAGLRLAATLDPGEVLETAGDLLIPALADWMEIRLDDQGPSYTAGTRKPEETVLSLPLVSQDQALGTLTVARHEGGHSRSERRYLEDLAARLALAYDNAVRYQNERRLALTLQRALLPQQLPQAPGLRIATYYRASSHGTEIGGDWYDVIALPGGCVGLAIGDVMGHDVDAATVMGRLRPALHGFALDTPDPARVLARLDTYLRSLDVEPFATCLYARYDAATHRLQYASSGHLPPLLVAGARTCFLKLSPGPPLGVGLGAAVNHETDLPPGAGLLLFTDGLVESRTLPISTGLAALRRTCRKLAVATPDDPQRIIDRALELLDAPGRVEDDTALLAATARSCGEAEHG
ncbi:SpoIIE family protein phosphatase [Actinacidiphila oryziradicis]|uniref:histidine kinase n=1 Tax=Actinacidiphila oryziradicis TaxID=2571141 RepID=A0A4U0SM48_9ACTN|nr:SpoIIE family protein phosphatase [Actinacidiphila oryziradicis]TKA09297.1 response regulator [Actinacidiphila oryziradicis]